MRRNARWAGTSFSPYGSLLPHQTSSDRLHGVTTPIGLRNLRNSSETRSSQNLVSSPQNYEDSSGGLMAGFATLMVELRECQGEPKPAKKSFLVFRFKSKNLEIVSDGLSPLRSLSTRCSYLTQPFPRRHSFEWYHRTYHRHRSLFYWQVLDILLDPSPISFARFSHVSS